MSSSTYGTTAGTEAILPDDSRTYLRNRVSWGAIFAGAVTALVMQVLFNMLGVGIGASSLDAMNTVDNPTAATFSTTAGIWWTVSGLTASLLGGALAGRLAGSADSSTALWHGFTSWCVATLVMAYLVTSAAGGIVGGTASALGSTLGALGRGAASAVSGAAQATDGDALQAQVRALINPNDAQNAQQNVTTYIRASIAGNTQEADAARERAINSIAQAANVSPEEARTRLQQAEQQARQAAETVKQKAQQAAEVARKSVATAGIYGFIALACGALAAMFGGWLGTPRNQVAVVSTRRA